MVKRGKIEMLADFMTGLNISIDASSQMVHARINPKWMAMRDMLNIVKESVQKLMVKM